jgi:hypothetical protein
MLNSENLKFSKYWKLFYKYILDCNIVFSIKKPFKKIKFIYFYPDFIYNITYNKYQYFYLSPNLLDEDWAITNNWIDIINKNESKKISMNNIQYRTLVRNYNVSNKNDNKGNTIFLGLSNYNIFFLKADETYNYARFHESYNLLKLVDKKDFIINFEQFYFKYVV